MPLAERQLEELIKRLEGEGGMRRKLRVMANSWSDLRELSPQQRERVALVIGNRWAWRNIEGLFGNPTELSDNQRQVKAFFDKLRGTGPEKLRQIGQEIREGEFGAARGRLLEAVGEALDEEPEDAEVPPKPIEVVPEPSQALPTAPEKVAVPAIEEVAVPAIEAATAPKKVAVPVVEEVAVPQEVAVPEKAAIAKETPRTPLRSDTSGASTAGLMRLLRRLSDGELSSSRSDRAAMVAGLSSGWAARRAVSAMIRSHSAADLDEALALIRQLPTATQRTWCLGDLIEHWDLDDTERRRVLGAVPTDSSRRRLASRAERLSDSRELR